MSGDAEIVGSQAPPVRGFTLAVSQTEERLDRLIARHHPELSRALVQRLIRERQVLINGATAKASYMPQPGDLIEVRLSPLVPETQVADERLALAIVYEDEYLLVVNKPAGLVVHPAPGHVGGTLVNVLLAQRPAIVRADLDSQRLGIVHRLDRDTSGLLLVATERATQAALQAQFKAHTVEKVYLALLEGHLTPSEGAIEARIGRDVQDRQRMQVVAEGGRAARTEYRVLECLRGCCYVQARPLTGRTHQLRVHFAAIGHPVVGDRLYGFRRSPVATPRQFLHAWRLTFTHPVTGERLTFTAELPDDLAQVLAALRMDNAGHDAR